MIVSVTNEVSLQQKRESRTVKQFHNDTLYGVFTVKRSRSSSRTRRGKRKRSPRELRRKRRKPRMMRKRTKLLPISIVVKRQVG